MSAQRLSASKVSTQPEAEKQELLAFLCSTPFGIKGFYAFGGAVDGPETTLCSTPFGIKGFYALGEERKQQLGQTCSTPFGIKGFYAQRRIFRILPTESAQRLSASKVSTQSEGYEVHPLPHVLNAFRHQRFLRNGNPGPASPAGTCSTPFGIKGFYARRRPAGNASAFCAQRLSASKVSTPRIF